MVKFHDALYEELKVFVRYSAWLSATPERAEAVEIKGPQLSRLEALKHNWVIAKRGRKAEDYEPAMPPLHGSEYLLSHFFEIGPTLAAGMGAGPVTFSEIGDWMQCTGVELQPWEARFIHSLSKEYLDESYKAVKRDRAAPWTVEREAAPPPVTATQAWIRSLAKI